MTGRFHIGEKHELTGMVAVVYEHPAFDGGTDYWPFSCDIASLEEQKLRHAEWVDRVYAQKRKDRTI